MKSPQFPTWSPARDLTKGGSVVGAFPAVDLHQPVSFRRSADGLTKARDVVERSRRAEQPPAVVRSAGPEPLEAETVRLPVPGWKRLLDCAAIFLTLPVALPLGLFITAWIKVVSPGPVFYRQARIGHGGRVFTILKFRSMKAGAPTASHEQHLEKLIKSDAPMTKLDGEADPRIIPGGRCLRAIGLDELPQLVNVLRGEMSLVGPRPSTPNEFALYTPEQKERAAVLPGLTGYWQVSGKNKLTFQQMINLDLLYTHKMCLGLDLAIVAATIPAMLLQFMESRCSGVQPVPPAGSVSAHGSPGEPTATSSQA